VQLPTVTKVRVPPDVIVHTPVVEDEKLIGREEVEYAVKVGVVPKFLEPGSAKMIVWLAGAAT
jgi:desulfoferrodoxin (superoxide reductase-like protein)